MKNIKVTLTLNADELYLLLTTMGVKKEELEGFAFDDDSDQIDIDRHAVVSKVFKTLQKKYYET